jgi:hypothetical protein
MACQRNDGGLPASRRKPDLPDRSDVTAQALRVGCILKALGRWSDERFRLKALSCHLARFESSDGAVCFYPKGATGENYRNVWNAMFSFQALSFFNRLEMGKAEPRKWIRYLI